MSVSAGEYKKGSLNNDNLEDDNVFTSQANLNEGKCTSEAKQKTIIGLVIVVLLATAWVGAQQYGQSAITSEDFDAAFFATWYSTCWMVLCYPGYCLFLVVFTHFSTDEKKFHTEIQNSLQIFGEVRITAKDFFMRIVPMNVLWVGVNYMYLFALKSIAATDASAIMASNVAFVYILSLILLKENFYVIRLIASLFCISGIVLISYSDGFTGGSSIGILLALGSAIGAAVYKVIFKVMVGQASLGQVSLFLSLLGFSNAIFLWTIFLLLYFTGVDSMVAATIPWQYLNISAALGLVFNFLVNFGIAFTYPLFISIAMMVGVPLNAGVDVIVKDVTFNEWRLIGAMVIIIGFALMLLPDEWNNPIHQFFGCKTISRKPADVDIDKNADDDVNVNGTQI